MDDNDQGPNTGGMGAYAPAPCLTDDLKPQVAEARFCALRTPAIRGSVVPPVVVVVLLTYFWVAYFCILWWIWV